MTKAQTPLPYNVWFQDESRPSLQHSKQHFQMLGATMCQ